MNRLIGGTLMGMWLLGGCTTAAVTPSASVTTLQPVWPRYFKLQWATEPESSNLVAGYVENVSGTAVDHVQLLAQAVDGSGAVVGQRIAWVPGIISPRSRAAFVVAGLPPGGLYRVSVWNFELFEPEASQ